IFSMITDHILNKKVNLIGKIKHDRVADIQSYLLLKMAKVKSLISPNPFCPPPTTTGSSGASQAPPAKTKVRITPPSPPRPPPQPKASTKPKAVPVDKCPAPKDAPAVSVARPACRRATHTTRGLTCRGLYLVPPAGSSFSAASFTSEVLC